MQIYAKKIMKSQSKKVNFEVFSCPGTLKIYLTTKQLASAFPNSRNCRKSQRLTGSNYAVLS
jgi:hypothetical protein